MEITAKVHEVGPIQQVSDTFKKRDLIVQYAENPQYPEFIKFEATQDRVSIFDGINPGDEVTVSFNLRGRPWTNKDGVTSYFNSLVAWRVNKASGSANNSSPKYAQPVVAPVDDNPDDLPF